MVNKTCPRALHGKEKCRTQVAAPFLVFTKLDHARSTDTVKVYFNHSLNLFPLNVSNFFFIANRWGLATFAAKYLIDSREKISTEIIVNVGPENITPVCCSCYIRITFPCNIYPLLHSETWVYRGIYIFLIFTPNIDCGYSLEPPRRGVSNVYPQSMNRLGWRL